MTINEVNHEAFSAVSSKIISNKTLASDRVIRFPGPKYLLCVTALSLLSFGS